VQAHAPGPRLIALLERLEALAATGRRPDRGPGGAAAGARWGAYGLSVETPTPGVIAGIERLLDAAEQAAPADGAVQVHRARLYAALAASGGPQAADALGWAGEHLDRALALDPGDAVARLALAQLRRQAGDAAGARALATALATDVERGVAVAQPDRVALDEPLGERIARQADVLAGGDPRPALTRRVAVATLRLAAETCADDPAGRAALLDRALALAGGAAPVRLELGMALLGVDPRAALPHSTQLLAERPLNGAVWLLHAYALALSGQADAARAFAAACGALAQRVRIDPGLLDRLRGAVS
jgi:hypothetical protein